MKFNLIDKIESLSADRIVATKYVSLAEEYLADHFAEEYREYFRRVNRWVPDFRGLKQATAGMQFNWRRVVLKEYGSTYAWGATALLLMAYDTLA